MILGVDPGTTVGWAVIDWDGNVVAKGSQREFDRDSLVKKLVPFGRFILVGTDKAKIPSFVQEVATSLGAVVQNPQFDLLVDEKREMTKGEPGNAHELDALAGAVFAMRRKEQIVRKIRGTLERVKKEHLFHEVVSLVIKEKVSIHSALAMFEPKEEEPEELPAQTPPKDQVKIVEALAKARSDSRLLEEKNQELQQLVEKLGKQALYLQRQAQGLVRPKTPKEIAKVNQSQIMSLEHRFAHASEKSKELQKKQERFEAAVLSGNYVPVPRLRSLGKQQVVKAGSTMYVDDATKASDRTIDLLRAKGVELLICEKEPERKLPFAVIKASNVLLGDAIAMVDKKWLEQVRSSKDVLRKVVEEYKKTRPNQ